MAKEKKSNKKGKKILLAILCFLLVGCIVLFAVGYNWWKGIKDAPPEVVDTMVYDFDDETQPEVCHQSKKHSHAAVLFSMVFYLISMRSEDSLRSEMRAMMTCRTS